MKTERDFMKMVSILVVCALLGWIAIALFALSGATALVIIAAAAVIPVFGYGCFIVGRAYQVMRGGVHERLRKA